VLFLNPSGRSLLLQLFRSTFIIPPEIGVFVRIGRVTGNFAMQN
jgi:hypothetical protein